MAYFDNTGYPSGSLKEKFYRKLESREGSFWAVANILYEPESKIPHSCNGKIYKLVLKYESHHFRISLGRWEEIFQQLGCLEEYNDIMEKPNCPSKELNANAGNDNRSSENNGDNDVQTLQAKSAEIWDLRNKVKALKQMSEIREILHKQQVDKLEEELKIREILHKQQVDKLEEELKTMKGENCNLSELLQKSQDKLKAKELKETKVRDQQRKLETLNFELTKQEKELQQQLDYERVRYSFLEMEIIRRDRLSREKWHHIACKVVKGDTLGRGAWGIVSKGTLPVAVKELIDVTPERLMLFKREMEVAFVCHHPNIVQFLGATSDPACPKLVMELMAGNLRDFMKRTNFQLPPEVIIQIAWDVAKGLWYLHSHNPPIIHRDIKSDNILLKDGTAKIGDLGSARFHQHNMTQNRGTVIYSAPEVQNGNNNQTPKMDVWSYGLVVQEMATGLRPKPWMLLQQIEKITSLKLKELVQHCTRQNASQRPTMEEVISFFEKEFTVKPP